MSLNNKEKAMDRLRKEDLAYIVQQTREDWEFEHHGCECPHNLSTRAFSEIAEEEGLFEVSLTRRLPREA